MRIKNFGLAMICLGLIGMAGACDTDKGWKFSIGLMGIGIVITFIVTIREVAKEFYEEYAEFKSYRANRTSHDASYPAYLRR